MLKIWNVALILSTYSLAVLGTFLTRSGLLSSVHTFSESPVGKYFLPFLAVLVIGSFALLGFRLDRLRSRRHLDAAMSRESMFLFNNLVFVAIAFTVLWGTLYPVVVEAVTGQQVSVGPPYFNAVVVPLGLALLGLMGIGPLVAWRRASSRGLQRAFTPPLAAGVVTIVALFAAGVRSAGAALAFALCAFVTVTIVSEFTRGTRAHRRAEGLSLPRALGRTLGRNRRRYGGYIVHLGVVLIFLGLAGGAFVQTWSGSETLGGSFRVGAYTLRFDSIRLASTPEKLISEAVMDVSRGGKHVTTLRPQQNFHLAQRQQQSEIALRSTLVEDLYVVVNPLDPTTSTGTFRAWVNPLVAWIWLGGVVMALGMVVILTARPPAGPPEPLPQEPSAAAARRKRETVAA
jgi:cytochrome c-type biogenesis protein CcmF